MRGTLLTRALAPALDLLADEAAEHASQGAKPGGVPHAVDGDVQRGGTPGAAARPRLPSPHLLTGYSGEDTPGPTAPRCCPIRLARPGAPGLSHPAVSFSPGRRDGNGSCPPGHEKPSRGRGLLTHSKDGDTQVLEDAARSTGMVLGFAVRH